MSLSAAPAPEPTMPILRFFDVVLIVVAAPIMLLIGVPAAGYLIGAGAWIGCARSASAPSTPRSPRPMPAARSRSG